MGDYLVAKVARAAVINGPDDFGNSPLHLAAWNECKHTFDWLIEERADPVTALPIC
jgi:ankyrin repeat protein